MNYYPDDREADEKPEIRRPWVTPRLFQMQAGSAELSIGGSDDGVDLS